jgi:hypothetical protein
MRFVQSALIGVLSAVMLGAIAFGLVPGTPVTEAYLLPGMYIGTVFARFLSSELIYSIVPEGGGLVFVGLSVLGCFLFWSLLFGTAFYVYKTIRSKRDA